MLKRILKMLMAQGGGVGVTLLTRFLLPPIFLHSYGVARYGEWLVLTAAVSYLSTLDFGIATYASNELTMLRERNEMGKYRVLQASTLAMILILLLLGTVVCVGIGFLPLKELLHLRSTSGNEARLTAAFLGLQLMANILGGYYNNLFMVLRRTHRGTAWFHIRRLAGLLTAAVLAWRHSPFAMIALGQFLAILLVTIATMLDLRIRMKGLPMGFGGANWETAKSTLKPSGMFGLILAQTFLLFQIPVILLQTLLGPEVVVLFSICRTILGTARQLLTMVTTAIAPEITFSFGEGNMKQLLRIFHDSERLVFALIPVANVGAYLLAPLLLAIWLHKPNLFEPWTYALMALISATMSMREHKQYFQFSTNTHHRLAMIVFWGNIVMLAVSVPATMRFGLHGFMVTWLLSELTQMTLLYRENQKLFSHDATITLVPVAKLVTILALSVPISGMVLEYARRKPLVVDAAIGAAGILVLCIVSYVTFGLNTLQTKMLARVGR